MDDMNTDYEDLVQARFDAQKKRIRELEAERDSLQEDVIEVTTRMATAEAIIHAIDFRLGRDGWTLELAQALGYSQSDREAK
jgi:multidrug resistance efflux pump